MADVKGAATLNVVGSGNTASNFLRSGLAALHGLGDKDMAAYEADAPEAPKVTEQGEAFLSQMAQELVDRTEAVGVAERALKSAEEDLAEIQDHRLPDYMERHGLPSFNYTDASSGRTYIIKFDEGYFVGLPGLKDKKGNPTPENVPIRKAIFAWLREIGSGGVLKKTIEAPVGTMSDEQVTGMAEALKAACPSADVIIREEVHAATLGALVKRRLKASEDVHPGINVTPYRKAKLK